MKTNFLNRSAKTTVLAAIMFFAFTMSAFAKPVEVSKYLLNQFNRQFRGATDVAWKTTETFTSATFMLNGENTAVYYDANSNLIGIAKVIDAEELPKMARQTLKNKYNDDKVVSVIDFTDADGNLSYYIELDHNSTRLILQASENGNVSVFTK